MESPSAYIPIDRRQAIALGETLPDQMDGTALFADISGFTPLTDAFLQALGPKRGADELTQQLNLVYDALIREVRTYRGSIISFSGDAITCWFDQDAGLRATACGLAMQQAMSQFVAVATPGGGIVSLSLKVAAASGSVRRFLIGDPQIQYIDVMAGATLDRMALAEKYAKKGEVLLSQEIVAQLDHKVKVAEWRGKRIRSTAPEACFAVITDLAVAVEAMAWPAHLDLNAGKAEVELTESQIRPWLLPPVYQRLYSGQGEFLAEIRPAVVLFLKFDGLDYDRDEAAGEKLDAYIRWVQNVLVRHDSYVMQLLIGDKGSYLYAIFGAPLAHDDDPERALSAAMELQASPKKFNFIRRVQLGIDQGRVRAGAYGSATRRTYGVLGDGVNIAARLMSRAAPGQVMVSQRIVEAARESYYFKYLGPIKFKGKRESITVSSVLSPRLPSAQRLFITFTDPLVGRVAQLHQLEHILTTMLAGQKQIVWVEGVTGIGKSHLVAEFAERAWQREVRVTVGICQSPSQAIPYYPWQQIFRNLFGLIDERLVNLSQDELFARQVAQLEAMIKEKNPDWLIRLPLLGNLLDLPIPDNPTTLAFEPQVRQDALFDLVEELLETWAHTQPLLLLLEDTHWMDEASRALLLSLSWVQTKTPILFILVQSLPGTERLWLELSPLSYAHHLKLDELSPQEVAALITQRLRGDVSSLVLDLIQAQAQGNPLFTRELVDALQESGSLSRRNDGLWWLSDALFNALQQANCLIKKQGQWLLVEHASLPAAKLDLPDSIHSIVLARLDRLPDPLKVTLKVASVIGRLFEFDLLAYAHPNQPSQVALLEQMALLQELDFIQRETSQPQLAYLFKHSITHEVTYATLLEQQERVLHQVVAEALEKWRPEAIERLAYHFSYGEARPQMLFYLNQAAGQTQREYANETALGYYTQALAVEEQWMWRKGQVEVLHILGRREEEKASLAALATNLETPTFEVGYLWGQFYEAIGNYAKAQAAIELALADSRDKENLIGEARCLAYLGLITRRQGNYEQAEDWYNQALALSPNKQSYTEPEGWSMTQTFNGLGAVYRQQGHFDQARLCHEQALALSRQTGNRPGEAQACNDLGVISLYQRHLAEALTYHQQALAIREIIGDRAGEGMSLHNLAQVTQETGDCGQAQKHLTEALSILQATGNRWEEVNVWNDLGILYQELGDLARAETCLQQGLTLVQAIGDEAGQAYLLANLGLVARDKLEPKVAEKLLTTGLVLAQAQHDQYLVSIFLNYLSTVSLQMGRLELALEQALASLVLRRELKMRFATPDNLATLAAIYLAVGDLTQSLDYASQTQTILEECGGEGPEFPQQDYFIVYQVLSRAGPVKNSYPALQAAYKIVIARADKITDPTLRQSFLEQVAINRAIVEAYHNQRVSPEPVV